MGSRPGGELSRWELSGGEVPWWGAVLVGSRPGGELS